MKKYTSICYITTVSIFFLSVMFLTSTKVKAATLPVFNNSAATIANIQDDGVNLSATISSVGGENVSARGFILGYMNSIVDTNYPISVYDTSASSYPAGSYSLSIDSLFCGKTYYVRAIATNSAGTQKGDIKTFTTLPCSGASPSRTELTGWAWSSSIGWLSLNCANTMGTCAKSPFKVSIDNTTGLLSGWAWSPNIGWVKFDGLSNYPVTVPQRGPATIGLQFGTTTGWIRACAGTVSGDCSTMESRTDGWDGWIELSGVNHLSTQTSNPTFGGTRLNTGSSGALGGNAWGNSVVGWLRSFGFGFLSAPAASPTPTVTPTISPEVINATCTKIKNSDGSNLPINGPGNITTGDGVTFTVSNPTPGGRTYNYKWYNGETISAQGSSRNHSHVYPTAKAIPSTSVTVIDTSGSSPLGQVSIECGKITVSDPELSLFINTDGSLTNAVSATVRRGSLFGLTWKNTLDTDIFSPDHYSCTASTPAVSLPNWDDNFTSLNVNSNGTTASNLNTPQTGEFEFKISCISETKVPRYSSVFLKVVSSSGNEF